MKKYLLALLLCGQGWLVSAQNLLQIEYFIDTDAGIGNNTIVSVSPSPDGEFPFTVNLAGVSPGRHFLYTRVKDANGRWSQTTRSSIEVYETTAAPNLVQLEYFIDTDAGFGSNTLITTAPGPEGEVAFNVNLSGVSPGQHFLYTRIKDSNGKWGQTTRRSIEVYNNLGPTSVIAVEYFFDSDPGFGAASHFAFAAPAGDGSFVITIPQNQVTSGLDTLFLRVKDDPNNNWSQTQYVSKTFEVVSCSVPGQPGTIPDDTKCSGVTVTYSIANVPTATGYNWEVPSGWNISNGQGTNTITVQLPVISSVSNFTVSVSATNTCGAGIPRSFQVTVNPNPTTPTISAGGPTTFCNGSNVELTSSASSGNQWRKDGADIAGQTGTTYSANSSGSYTVRVTNASGCSATSAATVVTVNNNPATPTISAGGPATFCNGSNVVLTSSAPSGNQWRKDGADIAGQTGTTYSANSSGSYTVRVTNASGCSATSSATVVTVNTVPPQPVITQTGAQLSSSAAVGNQWFLNGTAITGATGQNHTATTSGNYTVQVTVNGCSSPLSAVFNVVLTGVNDPVLQNEIRIFPNPVKDVINIINNRPGKISIIIYDMTGRELLFKQGISGNTQVPVLSLKQGCYLLRVTDESTRKGFTRLLFKE